MKESMEYEIDYFFLAGGTKKQKSFLIRPYILKNDDLNEILSAINEQKDKDDNKRNIEDIESYLLLNNLSPDPTNKKVTSDWHYAQIAKGAILFRYGFDGRRDPKNNKPLSTVEGMFIEGVSIDKTIKKYSKKDGDILRSLERYMPDDIEKYLITYNNDIFINLKRRCQKDSDLTNLFNQFYAICAHHEMNLTHTIQTRKLVPMSAVEIIDKNVKKLILKQD